MIENQTPADVNPAELEGPPLDLPKMMEAQLSEGLALLRTANGIAGDPDNQYHATASAR